MSPEEATGRALERRQERRIIVHLPMRVRGTDREGALFEEHTESKNLCRNGAAFVIQHDLEPGANLEIVIPLPRQGCEEESDFATRGRVIHVAPGKDKRERIVGVRFIGPRFHRIFVPETA